MVNERDFKIIIPITKQELIDYTARKMSEHFGGVTIFPIVRGYWWDKERGEMVKDDNILLFSSRDLDDVKSPYYRLELDREFMKELAEDIRKKTEQKSIWIEEDIIRDVHFIEAKSKERLGEVV